MASVCQFTRINAYCTLLPKNRNETIVLLIPDVDRWFGILQSDSILTLENPRIINSLEMTVPYKPAPA